MQTTLVINEETQIATATRTVDAVRFDINELEERYFAFCDKHDLDPYLQADEQFDLNESQQKWIDRHLNKITHLNIELNALSTEQSALDEESLHAAHMEIPSALATRNSQDALTRNLL